MWALHADGSRDDITSSQSAEGQPDSRTGSSAPPQLGYSAVRCSWSPGYFCQTLGEIHLQLQGLPVPSLAPSLLISPDPCLACVPLRLTFGAETGRLGSGWVSAWPGARRVRVTQGPRHPVACGVRCLPPVVQGHPAGNMGKGFGHSRQ